MDTEMGDVMQTIEEQVAKQSEGIERYVDSYKTELTSTKKLDDLKQKLKSQAELMHTTEQLAQ